MWHECHMAKYNEDIFVTNSNQTNWGFYDSLNMFMKSVRM